ncbi:MAG: hypothetical protein AB1757_30485 [Acidobacteriota bacterium]
MSNEEIESAGSMQMQIQNQSNAVACENRHEEILLRDSVVASIQKTVSSSPSSCSSVRVFVDRDIDGTSGNRATKQRENKHLK